MHYPHLRVHRARRRTPLAYLLITGAPLVALLSGTAIAQPLFIDSTSTKMPSLVRYENGMDVEAADLDRDGDLDLIVANEFQPNTILLNDGKGNFTEAPSSTMPLLVNDHEDIGVADFDNDNDLDLVFVSEDDSTHVFLLNNGAGKFAVAPMQLPTSIANSVIAADLTGDGFADLVIGNAGQDFFLKNDGKGGFIDETSMRLPVDSNVTQDAALADFDRDGDMDIIVGNEDGNKFLLNDGTGHFTDSTTERLPIAVDMETRKVTPMDVDLDGDMDVYFSNVDWNPLKDGQDRLYINNGSGVFTDETLTRLPENLLSTLDAKPIDFDEDGDPDLVTVHFPQLPPRVWRNDGAGVFSDATGLAFAAPVKMSGLGIEIADFNGDGRQDIYICDRERFDRLLIRSMASASVQAEGMAASDAPRVLRNFPNPFTAATTVEYYLPKPSGVAITIHDETGCTVASLDPGHMERGTHTVQWGGDEYPTGVYFFMLETEDGRTVWPLVRTGTY